MTAADDWSAADEWSAIERDWLTRPGIGTKRMLQSAGLTGRTDKVFASLIDDRLLLKLPAARVDELITAGVGERFTSGQRPMREWVTVGVTDAGTWADLVAEAHGFVNP